MHRGGSETVREMCRFITGAEHFYEWLRDRAMQLNALPVDYAFSGGIALAAYGALIGTMDMEIVVRPESADAVRQALLGTELPDRCGKISIRLTGTPIGKTDIGYPDPRDTSVEFDGLRYLDLRSLIETKLAAAISNPAMLKQLTEVLELIVVRKLPEEFAEVLHPTVREKYAELLHVVRNRSTDAE